MERPAQGATRRQETQKHAPHGGTKRGKPETTPPLTKGGEGGLISTAQAVLANRTALAVGKICEPTSLPATEGWEDDGG